MASLAQRMVQDVLNLMPWLTDGAIQLGQNQGRSTNHTSFAAAAATGDAANTHVGVGSPAHKAVLGVVSLWLALGCCYDANGKTNQAFTAFKTGCVLGLGHGGMLDAGFLAVYGPSQVSVGLVVV